MNELILEQRFVEITTAPKILSELLAVDREEPLLEVVKRMQLCIYTVKPSITLLSLAELSTLSREPEPSEDIKESIEKHSTFLGWGGVSELTGLGASDSKQMLRAINKHFNRLEMLNAPCSLFDVEAYLYNQRICFDLGDANAK
ncbi:MAG: hypothetical protein ACO3D2_05240 [Holophagaceae bacterium]